MWLMAEIPIADEHYGTATSSGRSGSFKSTSGARRKTRRS